MFLWVSTAFMATGVFLGRFDQLDAQRIGRTLGRVRDGVAEKQRQMATGLKLWLKDNRLDSASFQKSSGSFLSEFNLNLLALVSTSGRVDQVSIRSAPGGEGRLTSSDEAMIAELVQSVGRDGKKIGLVQTSLGPMLFAVESITRQDEAVPSPWAGAVAGIFLGGDYEQTLRNSLLADLTILPATGSMLDLFRLRSPENQQAVIVPPHGKEDEIAAYSLLRDVRGEPLLVIKVAEARQSYLDGTANLRFFLGITAAFSIIVTVVGTLLVEVMVVGRIRRLTHSARRADINGMDDLPVKFLKGRDEISSLAKATKSMVDRLKASQVLYRAVVETQTELIVRFKPDGEITLANEAFAKFFGRHLRAVDGKNIRDFFTTAVMKGADILGTLPTGANRSIAHDFPVLLEGSRECWLQWSQRALVADDHSITEIQAAGHDITLRRDYEHKLKTAKEAAEAADRAKSEFLTVMSHETRTPLTSILGFTAILENTPLSPEQIEYLHLIRSSGDSLLLLLNDLLDYSNVASGRIELHPVTLSVAALAREIVATQTPEARARNLDLDLDVEVDAPPYIEADAGRVRQVLHNVLSNGIKFTERGFVRLSVKPGENGMIRFLVQDTGIGIPDDALPRLFEAFGSTDASNSRGHGGAGVGLAVSRKVLDRLGGTITVRSEQGIGSLFTITLPVGSPKTPEATGATARYDELADASDKPDFSSADLDVLVVEDNLVNQKVIKRILQMIGIRCEVASGGRECLEMTARKSYDIIFMDVQMPEMDGYETVARLRHREASPDNKSGSRTHIVACTAFSLPGDREKCILAGMDNYVSKPVRIENLATTVQAFLDKEESSEEPTVQAAVAAR